MFCVVTAVRTHVLYFDSGTCTFCIVTAVRVRVLYCDSGTCTFCVVTAVRVRVLYCDSVTREKSLKSTALGNTLDNSFPDIPKHKTLYIHSRTIR